MKWGRASLPANANIITAIYSAPLHLARIVACSEQKLLYRLIIFELKFANSHTKKPGYIASFSIGLNFV